MSEPLTAGTSLLSDLLNFHYMDSSAFSIHIVEQISRPADFIPLLTRDFEQTDQLEVCFRFLFSGR